MHPYSTSENRVAVYAVLGLVAVFVSWLVVALTDGLDLPQWPVSAPTAMGVYGGLYQTFDKVLWKSPAMRFLRLSTTPDLSGIYVGALASTYVDENGVQAKRDVQLSVRQTWTRLRVGMVVGQEPRTSTSRSVAAALDCDDDEVRLLYSYRNVVNPGVADDDLGDHDGTAQLALEPDRRTMQGRYFNGRRRAGSLVVTRQSG